MPLLTRKRYATVLFAFGVLGLVCLALAPLFGPERIPAWETLRAIWQGQGGASRQADILLALRLPRVALAFLAGGALALTGVVFQALLRNPLADPYTLGVASAGSLGAVVAMFVPALQFRWGAFSSVQLCSFVGAAGAIGIIYLIARAGQGISSIALLLVGVTMGFICGAAILSVRYIASPNLLVEMDRWLMGGLDVTGWLPVMTTLPMLVAGSALLLMQARHYDQIACGEELAAGRGCNVGRLQATSFLGGSLLTASVVASVGPIGFVGLIVPHALRRALGPDHRVLLPASFLGGGAFLVVCDTFARSIRLQPPVGILTALLGGPFFLYLLIRSRGQWDRGGMS